MSKLNLPELEARDFKVCVLTFLGRREFNFVLRNKKWLRPGLNLPDLKVYELKVHVLTFLGQREFNFVLRNKKWHKWGNYEIDQESLDTLLFYGPQTTFRLPKFVRN